MFSNKRSFFIQAIGLVVFCFMAMASSSSKGSSSSSYDIDWRGAAVGGAAGYNGMILIGKASSQSDAERLAASKGYSEYLWDSVNHNVYAK